MTTKNLTPYNEANEREISMMVGKAMCAWANWQSSLKALYGADNDTDKSMFRQNAVAAKSECEATVRCIEMFVKDNIYTVQNVVRKKAEAEFGVKRWSGNGVA